MHRFTLVLFLHPQCPCSHATLEELNQLTTRCHDRLAVEIYILQPSGESEMFSHTSLWTESASIAGASAVHADRDGIVAAQFGAHTSGETFVYDDAGRLLFAGGITGSRGHAGDNAGLDAVLRLVQQPPLSGSASAVVRTPTFGCALQSTSSMKRS